jgi:hypothetical protein
MDKGYIAVKQQREGNVKCDSLSQVRRDLQLFEKTTLKSVSTIVKNTLPSQRSESVNNCY